MMTEDEVPVVAQRTPPPVPSRQGDGLAESETREETFREVRS